MTKETLVVQLEAAKSLSSQVENCSQFVPTKLCS
jgi:hypothetical protein